ncbi:MAG: DUF1576 domain-containing protein [Oscillospiraceae bacterium]
MISANNGLRHPYRLLFATFVLLFVFAFFVDSPAAIWNGLVEIFTGRALLVTDYISVGGLGAALVNAAITGFAALLFVHAIGSAPNGALTMAIFLCAGFSFFGKTLLNCLPILAGVWLHARLKKEPMANYSLVALLSSTLAPVVSEIAFQDFLPTFAAVLISIATGIATGIIVPTIAAATTKVHSGYNLYNVGFAGGLIALFIQAIYKAFGLSREAELHWSSGNNLPLFILLLLVCLLWIVVGLYASGPKTAFNGCRGMMRRSGRLVTDFYLLYGPASFVNMGILGLFATLFTLALSADLNGGTLVGIFTIMGFGAFGKHLRNCIPVMGGATIAAFLMPALHAEPVNICAILFCTGLAPIAGQYGWIWGVVAGALHTILINHISAITGGLNLYNNGFIAGFVALFLLPVILELRKGKTHSENEV